jgi:membrane associated rhomboid family serine protease
LLIGIQLVVLGGFMLVLWARRGYFGTRLQEHGIAVRRRLVGPEHQSTLIAMGELADRLTYKGNYEAALRLRTRVLTSRQRTLGDAHHTTVMAVSGLADTLTGQGNYVDALRLRRWVLNVHRAMLADRSHPATLTVIGRLADTLTAQGAATDVSCPGCGSPGWRECLITGSGGVSCTRCAADHGLGARIRRAVSVMPVTWGLIALNALVFLAEGSSALTVSGSASGSVVDGGSVLGSSQDPSLVGQGVAHGQLWRLVTGGFLHADLTHIGSNMLMLYLLGRLSEPAIGRINFAVIYIVSLLSGSLGALLADPHSTTIGASGAVFGVMGAAAVDFRSREISLLRSGLAPTIILNLLLSFSVSGISWAGHVGGLIGGALAAVLIQRGSRHNQRALALAGCGLMAAGSIAVAAASAQSSEQRLKAGDYLYSNPLSCHSHGSPCEVDFSARIQTTTNPPRLIKAESERLRLSAGETVQLGVQLNRHTMGILHSEGSLRVTISTVEHLPGMPSRTSVRTVTLR